jgi:glyoxylase-like metal-dependent hydrolase (beta-lactamase superfamily II)
VKVLPLQTPTLPPATHTNCYRVGDTVVDPASPDPAEQQRLWEWLQDSPPRRILLTHHHGDHIGGVQDLVRRCGALVGAHPDADLPFPVDFQLLEGDRIDTGEGTLLCLHTPGHADGHLCYALEGTDELIIGDMMASVGTIVLVPPEGKLSVYLASLHRLQQRGGRFYPAHGAPIEDGAALASAYISHRHFRTEQIRAALRAGADQPLSIAQRVYAGLPGVNLQLAALQLQTHLSYLLELGEAAEKEARWSLIA